MNSLIVDVLKKQAVEYKKDSSKRWKLKALNKAIKNIEVFTEVIISGDYAKKNISGIGDGLSKRIDEILSTGTLKGLENQDDTLNKMMIFKSITGVGDTRARQWVKQGITSLDELKSGILAGTIKSTHHIDIGLKYYDDFNERIPRTEIDNMNKILNIEISKISKNILYDICGSYRRGRQTCGDIDILVTDKTNKKNYLKKIVNVLKEINFIVDDLTSTSGGKKYMGVCKHKDNLARRIDIRFVKYEDYFPALIYFTGSKNFNIVIRQKALDMGYSLNEYGFTNLETKEKIVMHSEMEIFDFLKTKYLSPLERDI